MIYLPGLLINKRLLDLFNKKGQNTKSYFMMIFDARADKNNSTRAKN